jgi:hypothetical protein
VFSKREIIMQAGVFKAAAMLPMLLACASGVQALEPSGASSGLRFSNTDALQLSAPASLPFRGRGEWVWTRITALPATPAWSWRLSPPEFSLWFGDEAFHPSRTGDQPSLSWQPLSLGAWRLGASLGLMTDLPGSPAGTTWATFPTAAYEGERVRVNLGLLPPRGTRDSMLLMRFTVPLH